MLNTVFYKRVVVLKIYDIAYGSKNDNAEEKKMSR